MVALLKVRQHFILTNPVFEIEWVVTFIDTEYLYRYVFSDDACSRCVDRWCRDNNIKIYHRFSDAVGFLHEEDAMLCYLTFS